MLPMKPLETILLNAENVGQWKSLIRKFSISDKPFSDDLPPYILSPEKQEQIKNQVIDEGYFALEQILPETEISHIASAIKTICKAGLPPVFCFVYDQIWKVFFRLDQILTPILDPDFKLQTADIWAWLIDKDSAGFRPHRDLHTFYAGPDGRPSNLTIWIPFTDTTPLNGCMYLLPTNMDPNFPNNLNVQSIDDVQCIRAVPAKAGAVLGWTGGIIHWGARSSHLATEPRISIGVSYNRSDHSQTVGHGEKDYSLGAEMTLKPDTKISLIDRLQYIGESIWFYRDRVTELFPNIAEVLFDFCSNYHVSSRPQEEFQTGSVTALIKNRKRLAHQMWQAGKHAEAQIAMQQICKDYPSDADAWQLRGQLENALSQPDEAERCFNRAIALQKNTS